MLRPRVIPCLLVSQGGLVKTRRFSNATYVGDPNNAIRIFNEKEVDELIVLDIDASRQNRGPDLGLIEQFASECYMPVTYGGGIRSVKDAATVLSLGIEKVSIQTSAVKSPTVITEIASRFGSQSVVASVDLTGTSVNHPRLRWQSRWKKNEHWLTWLKTVRDHGAGEILLTDVDREGTSSGPNLEIVREASASVDVPVIAQGGVATLSDIGNLLRAGASGVAAGSFFVFYGPHRAVLMSYLSEEDFSSLEGQQ